MQGELAWLSFERGFKRRDEKYISLFTDKMRAIRHVKSGKKRNEVFIVMTMFMYEDGYRFAESGGLWFLDVDEIPPKYLRLQ